MDQWIDDNKSVYIREDLADYLICCNNLGVIRERYNSRNNENICERNYGKAV